MEYLRATVGCLMTRIFLCLLISDSPSKLLIAANWGTFTNDFYTVDPNIGDIIDVETFREVQQFKPVRDKQAMTHFRILGVDDRHVLLGGRNTMFNVSLGSLQEVQANKIVWAPVEEDSEACLVAQRYDEEECQNYIQLAAKHGDDELFVCGTQAFKASCRTYQKDSNGEYQIKTEHDGNGRVPYNRKYPSTSLVSDGRLYTATNADPMNRDALIFSEPLPWTQTSNQDPARLRTEQYDNEWLNQPEFIHSFATENHVNFLFHETATEYINCGKTRYTRIARVCKNDRGGRIIMRGIWTSFFKARLNCSIPGDYPFYFDEIVAATDIGLGLHRPAMHSGEKEEIFYAVFNTPENSLHGSAVCAFRYADVEAAFSGPFKEQKNSTSMWLPVSAPSPHPARSCEENSADITSKNLMFIKSHSLMDQAVPTAGGRPIFLQSSFKYRLTKIAVDFAVLSADGKLYDIIFVGTTDGRVVKMINKSMRDNQVESVVIEELLIFSDRSPITDLKLHEQKLIVVSPSEVKTVPLNRCHLKNTCSECVSLQDPYCSWDKDGQVCRRSHSGIQSIEDGRHSECPPIRTPITSLSTKAPNSCKECPICPDVGNTPYTTTDPHDGNNVIGDRPYTVNTDPVKTGVSSQPDAGITPGTLALAIVMSILLTLVITVVVIILFVRWRRSRKHNDTASNRPEIDPDSAVAFAGKKQPVKAEARDLNQLASSPSQSSNIYQTPPLNGSVNGGRQSASGPDHLPPSNAYPTSTLERQRSFGATTAPNVHGQTPRTATLDRPNKRQRLSSSYQPPNAGEPVNMVTEYKDSGGPNSTYSEKYPIKVQSPTVPPTQSKYQLYI